MHSPENNYIIYLFVWSILTAIAISENIFLTFALKKSRIVLVLTYWLFFLDFLSFPVFNKWQMNPYDRGSAFGKCLNGLVWFWTLHFDTGSLFPLLCCNKMIILHLVFLLQLLVQMACAVRAESSKSGMAVVPPKQSQKVRGRLSCVLFLSKTRRFLGRFILLIFL